MIQKALNLKADRMADADDADTPEQQSEDQIQDDAPYSEPTEPDVAPPHSGRNKNQSWWTDEYKEARSYLYETKTSPPDSILLYHIKFIEQIPDYDFLGK